MDVLIILILFVANGLFAMAEISIVSSRRTRLQQWAEEHRSGAATALKLNQNPALILSTVQVGITVIGVLNAIVGENTLAKPLAELFFPYFQNTTLAGHEHSLALFLVVLGLTYGSVVIGEIVPKRLALLGPEKIATVLAAPMLLLSRILYPLVFVLESSSNVLLKILRAKPTSEPPITNEEIKVLMEQGAEAGVFHESEQEIVSNVLRLDEQKVASIMTHRIDIEFIDLDDSSQENLQKLVDSPYARMIACTDGLDNVLGILQTSDLLPDLLKGQTWENLDIKAKIRPAIFMPKSITTTQLLEEFRAKRTQIALVVDEYGEMQGMVTLTDVLTSIVGDMPTPDETDEEQEILPRPDGTFLIDGMLSIEKFKEYFELDELPDEDEASYTTIAGFVMNHLGKIPQATDFFDAPSISMRFEVMDMDKHRIDKLLVTNTNEDKENNNNN